MELLENRVQTLTQNNTTLQQENEALVLRVTQLETQLRQQSAMGGGIPGGMGVPPANAFLAASSKFGGFNPMMGMNMNMGGASEMELQRRAAMVGLGGATTGLGASAAPSAGGPPSAEALRYFQLMQQAKNQQASAAGNMQANDILY